MSLPVPPSLDPIQVGPQRIDCPVILAPMTGVTDLPFRRLVRRYGSGLNVTEMIASPAAILDQLGRLAHLHRIARSSTAMPARP